MIDAHTIGPWLVHDKSTLHMNDQCVARVGEYINIVTHSAVDGQTRGNQAANARLIAAAPDLLAFAEDVADNYDHDEDAHRYDTRCRKCEAEALIKQIRGVK